MVSMRTISLVLNYLNMLMTGLWQLKKVTVLMIVILILLKHLMVCLALSLFRNCVDMVFLVCSDPAEQITRVSQSSVLGLCAFYLVFKSV